MTQKELLIDGINEQLQTADFKVLLSVYWALKKRNGNDEKSDMFQKNRKQS